MTVIDEYLATAATPTQRTELERIRAIAKRLVPDAEETISYGIPTLKYKKKYVIYFAAFKDHMSIFPGSGTIVGKMGDELAAYRTSKGTLQFTEANPLSDALIEEIVRQRLAEITKS